MIIKNPFNFEWVFYSVLKFNFFFLMIVKMKFDQMIIGIGFYA